MGKTFNPEPSAQLIGKNARLHTYGVWQTIKGIFCRQCYKYPVVYTDGLASYFVEDSKGREAFGIAVGNYVIPLHGDNREMNLGDAIRENSEICFAGRGGCFPPIEMLRYIRRNITVINKMIEKFGGNPLTLKGLYAAQKLAECNLRPALDFAGGSNCLHYLEKDSYIISRPLIDVSDLF